MDAWRLLNRIKSGEGLKLVRYQDHKGVWTIGYGTTHFLGEKVTQEWKKITKATANEMLYLELMKAILSATSSVSNFQYIGSIRQEAMAELVYQLGEKGWMRFVKTRTFIQDYEFGEAAIEIKDSNLWRDPLTQARCNRYAKMLMMGEAYD